MQEITYSIIIPHKNCPDLLRRCVDSIPVREDIQVIVVDDNSKDNLKPCGLRKGVEVILLNSDHAKGAGRARNVGLKHAKGEWLLFADADDYYKSYAFDILDKYVKSDNDIVYFNFEYLDGATNKELTIDFKALFDDYDGSQQSIDKIKFYHNVPWTKMFNHDFVKQFDLKYEEVIKGNDIFFSMMAGYVSKKIAVELEPLYVYLRNDNSISNRDFTKDLALCNIFHEVKMNYFYGFVGHPEWQMSILKVMVKYLVKTGLPFLVLLLKNTSRIIATRTEWVDYALKLNNRRQF